MYTHKTNKRVRYNEVDRMGYFYYGRYAELYEIGRVELLRELGFKYKDLEEIYDIIMPVLQIQSRFIKPAFYDDLLTIETSILEFPTKISVFHTKVFNPKEELIHKGVAKLVYIDKKSNKRISTPKFILDKLKDYF